MSQADVVVVGGGLAGLACAADLHAAGRSVLLLEGSDRVGGRVRTDEVDGFLLDRGFQVLLEGYPRLQARLDYDALELKPFYTGSLVRVDGDFHRMADPAFELLDAIRSVTAPVGSLTDKLWVATLRRTLRGEPAEDLLQGPNLTTEEALREYGFSSRMIDRFFRPFFGGVFLDRELQVSSRLFRYYFRMFAEGRTSLPAGGMEELSRRLTAPIPEASIRTEARVREVAEGSVVLENGDRIHAGAIVVATEGPAAARLLTGRVADPGSRSVTCLYFDAPASPLGEGVLVVNGDETGPVNNLAVLSDVAPSYAPPGRSLISVSVLEGHGLGGLMEVEHAVRRQLTGWYGGQVHEWRPIQHYEIFHAQPLQTPEHMDPAQRPVQLSPWLFVCGDHRENASLNGAISSGERAARAVLGE